MTSTEILKSENLRLKLFRCWSLKLACNSKSPRKNPIYIFVNRAQNKYILRFYISKLQKGRKKLRMEIKTYRQKHNVFINREIYIFLAKSLSTKLKEIEKEMISFMNKMKFVINQGSFCMFCLNFRFIREKLLLRYDKSIHLILLTIVDVKRWKDREALMEWFNFLYLRRQRISISSESFLFQNSTFFLLRQGKGMFSSKQMSFKRKISKTYVGCIYWGK